MERYKAKRLEIQSHQQTLSAMERTLSSLNSEESSRIQAVNIIQNKIASIDKEIRDQEAKRDRAFKNAIKGAKELKKSGGREETFEQVDFRIRECKDLANLVQSEISRIMEQHPEISMRIMELYSSVAYLFFFDYDDD